MTKWEYIVVSTSNVGEFINRLNWYGGDGWEAISGVHCIGEETIVNRFNDILGRSIESPVKGDPLWVAVMKREVS